MRTVSLFSGGVEGGITFQFSIFSMVKTVNMMQHTRSLLLSLSVSESLLKALWDSRVLTRGIRGVKS